MWLVLCYRLVIMFVYPTSPDAKESGPYLARGSGIGVLRESEGTLPMKYKTYRYSGRPKVKKSYSGGPG